MAFAQMKKQVQTESSEEEKMQKKNVCIYANPKENKQMNRWMRIQYMKESNEDLSAASALKNHHQQPSHHSKKQKIKKNPTLHSRDDTQEFTNIQWNRRNNR